MEKPNDIASATVDSTPKKSGFAARFHGFVLFLKASVAAQIASWVDMGLGIVLKLVFNVDIKLATAIGAVTGGIINCSINYKWTFKANACSVPAVVIKYFLVWIGSLLLNMYGTAILDNAFANSTTLAEWGIKAGVYTTVARVGTSLLVSIFWNFMLQRYFVYRYNTIDPFLDGLINPVVSKFKRKNAQDGDQS